MNIFNKISDAWPEGEQINMTMELQSITLEVITYLWFGSDASSIIKNCVYINPDGSESVMEFGPCFMKLLDDCLNHYMSLKFLLFPFLAYRNLIEPFKTDKKNIDNINKDLLNFSKISKDNRSALNKVISKKNIDLETAVNNIKSFLVGGIETSARRMSSIIYYMAKYPNWYEKLVNKLKPAMH